MAYAPSARAKGIRLPPTIATRRAPAPPLLPRPPAPAFTGAVIATLLRRFAAAACAAAGRFLRFLTLE
ncbi:hypothetical protein GCM10009802_63290 [Streptomyces synnematoformans]|uniref:Uncharacterized protein n=1 Tax=Streptomyces synnematoformans TaxID=415721 RepID=A0ABP4KU44_9ACTN